MITCGNGTGCAAPTTVSNPKIVTGTHTAVTTAGVIVTFTGSAVFTSATSYDCTAQNMTNITNRVRLVQNSGAQITLYSQNTTISVNYVCVGN
ncbi:MAG TPA: hypothetical protein VII83_00925 [Gaiellaceae bacterium]